MDVFAAEVALGSMLIIETKLAGGVLAPRRSAFAAVRGGRRLHEALMPVEGNSCDRDVCVINSGSFGASPWPCPKKKKRNYLDWIMYEMRRLPTVTRVWPAAEVRAGGR